MWHWAGKNFCTMLSKCGGVKCDVLKHFLPNRVDNDGGTIQKISQQQRARQLCTSGGARLWGMPWWGRCGAECVRGAGGGKKVELIYCSKKIPFTHSFIHSFDNPFIPVGEQLVTLPQSWLLSCEGKRQGEASEEPLTHVHPSAAAARIQWWATDN